MYNNYIPLFEFSVVETLLSIFIILLSVVIFIAISLKYRNNYHEGLLVFSLHSIWSVIFLVLSQYYGFSDSSGWYTDSYDKLGFGEYPKDIFQFHHYSHNYLMYVLNLSFSILGLKYLSISLLFNLFSSIGLMFFYIALCKNKVPKIYFFILFLFLPSFMFWTSGISKDSLILFPIGILIYCCSKFEKKIFKILFFSLIVFLIRPYFGLIIIISIFSYYLLSYLFFSKIKTKNLIFLFFVGIIVYIILDYVLGRHSFSNILSFIKVIQSQYQDTFLAIPKDQNFILRIFSYYFGPSILNLKGNIIILLASIENLILFIFVFYLLVNLDAKNFLKIKKIFFLTIFIFFSIIFFSQLTNNLGTAMRQKWMTLPFIFFILFSNQKVLIFYKKRT